MEKLRQVLAAAASLRDAGENERAWQVLEAAKQDTGVMAVQPHTALGLPRKLHAAMLRTAKRDGNALLKIAYQYHLVPDPALLADLTKVSPDDRRAIVAANQQAIPRIIHQIWIGERPVPEATRAWASHAASNGYQYKLWREADLQTLGIDVLPEFNDMLAAGDYPGAVDVARYVILAREGGIYLDCDWYPARMDRSFDAFMSMAGLTAMAEPVPRNLGWGSMLLYNSFIAAPAGHPAMTGMIEAIPDVLKRLADAPAWWSTGPLLFTLIARRGPIQLLDPAFVAASFKAQTPLADIRAASQAAEAAGGANGLLMDWKEW